MTKNTKILVGIAVAIIWGISMIPQSPPTIEQKISNLYEQRRIVVKRRDHAMKKTTEYINKNNAGMAYEWNKTAIEYQEQVKSLQMKIRAMENK